MNSFIEFLNQRSGNVLSFAWPMLWQSSLLIAVLFAFDCLFQRRLRASIRYALWLVVLVKLCLPPTLALPTSPAWWLHQTPPPIAINAAPHYNVTYDHTPMPEKTQVTLPALVPSKPAMNLTAWLSVVSTAVSSALFGWLLVRWWQISRQVRHAKTSAHLVALAYEAQKIIGVKFNVKVKLTANSTSPAACGLFRPAILIPRTLAENFSDEQLRAVLLHELIHLRRRDVWLNFLQTLLQIFYWWHPLVWLANARIRRVREEAVDDAVMLALRDEAETYAPTLLEVARLALNRPLASLGLVGILESRHALRQRIERLVDFSPPKKAGLTLVSAFGILAFTAVAVPMGEAPTPAEKQNVPAVGIVSAVAQDPNPPAVLITGSIYQLRPADFEKFISGLKFNPAAAGGDPWWSVSPEKFRKLADKLKSSGVQPITRPRIQTSSGKPAQMFVGDGTNGIEFDCTPFVVGEGVELLIEGKVVDAKVNEAITNQFSAKTSVENYGGIVIRAKNVGGHGESNVVIIAGVQLVTNLLSAGSPIANPAATTLRAMTFKLDQPIRQTELKEKLLAAGVKFPATAFFYTDSGILLVSGSEEQLALVNRLVLKLNGFSPKEIESADKQFVKQTGAMAFENASATNLFMRTFRVDPNTFFRGLENVSTQSFGSFGIDDSPDWSPSNPVFVTTQSSASNPSELARAFFSNLGVNLQEPPGKSVYYNDRRGFLFVKATEADLDTIERAVQALNTTPPQIHIKARFLEVPKGTVASFGKLLNPTNAADQFTGILSATNAEMNLHSLDSRKGIESLGDPEGTTLSGRQMQMRATTIVTVITNWAYHETWIDYGGPTVSNAFVPQTSTFETGPILDVVPYVLADGYTINLTVISSVTKFLGYYDAHSIPGIQMLTTLPKFSVMQMTANLNLWDGQTAVIGGMPAINYPTNKTPVFGHLFKTENATTNEILVFITATIVDPAGNRVHTDDELPFSQTGIPPQPPPAK